MLCSLLFRNCNTLEDYKHALENKVKIFTVLDFLGLLAVLLGIISESTTLFTFSDFVHGFLCGFGISLTLVSTIVICHTKKLLKDKTKLLNKWEQFKQGNQSIRSSLQ